MPFENEHACRVNDPDKYTRFRRQNGIGKVDGKRLDAIIGFKDGGGSEIQSFRYPLSEHWTATQARSHCREHNGNFEAAKEEESMDIDTATVERGLYIAQLEQQLLEAETLELRNCKAGLCPAPIVFKQVASRAREEDGHMVFVASEESEDRLGDVVDVHGWDMVNFKKNPVFLFMHDQSHPPLGTVTDLWVEGKQLMAKVKWDDADPFAQQIKGKYERGIMRAVSVGFRPIEFEEREGKRGFLRGLHFKKQELLELSAVSVPAHPAAIRKALAGVSEGEKMSEVHQEPPESRSKVMQKTQIEEKVGATISRATRERLEGAIGKIESGLAQLREVLESKPDKEEEEKGKKGHEEESLDPQELARLIRKGFGLQKEEH